MPTSRRPWASWAARAPTSGNVARRAPSPVHVTTSLTVCISVPYRTTWPIVRSTSPIVARIAAMVPPVRLLLIPISDYSIRVERRKGEAMTDTTLDRPNTADESTRVDRVLFNLRHVARIGDLLSPDTVTMDDIATLLGEAARFSREQLAPLNRDGDINGAAIIGGQVTMPGRWGDAYRAWVDAGWNTITFPSDVGGGGLPFSVGYAVGELFGADNTSFQISPMLTQGAVDLLLEWARHDT